MGRTNIPSHQTKAGPNPASILNDGFFLSSGQLELSVVAKESFFDTRNTTTVSLRNPQMTQMTQRKKKHLYRIAQ